MRIALAILFSSLLVWAQTAACAQSACAPAVEVGCSACPCAMVECCVSEAPASDGPLPAVPFRGDQRPEAKVVGVMVALLLRPATPVVAPMGPLDSSPFLPSAVPLYRWNCAYLI